MGGQNYSTTTDRYHEESEILNKVSQGKTVDHFETQRLHYDNHLVDLSVTISPIYNSLGEIIGASKIARDITSAKQAAEKIKNLAFYDSLTGLANRRLLFERLDNSLNTVVRDCTSYALLFLDLDNFKVINDTQGHDAGDEVLKLVSKRLLSVVRKSDTVARFGGDEFVIMIKHTGKLHLNNNGWLIRVINKIIYSLQQPFLIYNDYYNCTTSLGAVVYDSDTLLAHELLKLADSAMYEAKFKGKNRFKIHGNS